MISKFMSHQKISVKSNQTRNVFDNNFQQDNDVTVCSGSLYFEKEIELLWLIRQGMIYEEN